VGKQAKLKYLFQPQEMERQLRRAAAGDLEAADKSWLLIVLETWLREFDVTMTADVPSPSNASFALAAQVSPVLVRDN